MSMQQTVAILGAASGSLGSIITAFSMNTIVHELNIARQGIEQTVELLASNQRNIPVYKGFDERYRRATKWSNKLVWLGVFLLISGFILQATSVVMGP